MDTLHYQMDRKNREQFIRENIGYGKPIQKKIIDKGHPDGPEIHLVTDTGIIIIYNAWTKRHITDLIGRENQLKRYNTESWICPTEVLQKARYHEKMGWNFK